MKKILLSISAFALMAGAQAQTIYDAQRFTGSDLNGTARFVGMGGAMGALGGDISTIGTNPAGIGIYRSHDFMTSFGFNHAGSESKYPGYTATKGNTRMSYDNVGFVYSNKIGNQTPLRYVNFAFNYHKSKNFNKGLLVNGDLNGSQTDQMAYMSSGKNINNKFPWGIVEPDDFLSEGAFLDGDLSWLGILGYEALLINADEQDEKRDVYLGYLPYDKAIINGLYKSRETGGINTYDFNLSFNFIDQIYVGATLGVHDVDYQLHSSYSETFYVNNEDYGNYQLNTRLNTFGTGVDFKLGVIVRPSLEFPLRVGVAVHTPTFYNLTDRNSANIHYDTQDLNGDYYKGSLSSQDKYGYDMSMDTDYRVVTPWKFNFSLGYTIGNFLALGAEYELLDRSTTKLKSDNNGYVEEMYYENQQMKDMLKATHTMRLGLEAKLVPEFSIRAGYNHTTAGYERTAFKDLAHNSVRTDTEYSNDYALNNFTLGMGYKGSSFYADLAYQYSMYKSDFYPFTLDGLLPATVTNDRHQVLMTLGFRF